jgi:hypothetical protein
VDDPVKIESALPDARPPKMTRPDLLGELAADVDSLLKT